MKFWLLLIIFTQLSLSSLGSEVAGLQLKGKALLEFSIFKIDVYEISYFTNQTGDHQKLILDYKVDVARKYSIEGWTKSLKPINKDKKYEKQFQWIINNTIDLRDGDKFAIEINKDAVSLFKNEKRLAQNNDPKLKEIILYPWIGEQPIDMDIKNKLLGIKDV